MFYSSIGNHSHRSAILLSEYVKLHTLPAYILAGNYNNNYCLLFGFHYIATPHRSIWVRAFTSAGLMFLNVIYM